jgi:hypothetical protein
MNGTVASIEGNDMLRQLDEIIIYAEEREVMQHYGQCQPKIRFRWPAMDGMNEGAISQEERTVAVISNNKRPRLKLFNDEYIDIDVPSIEICMHVVRTTMLLPRCISVGINRNNDDSSTTTTASNKEPSKTEIVRHFIHEFRRYCVMRDMYKKSFFWNRFDIHLQSANPTSWRFMVTGYRDVVNFFLVFIEHLLSQT